MKRITMILSCLVALCVVADVNAQSSRRQQRRAARNGQVVMSNAVNSTIMLSQPSQSPGFVTAEQAQANVEANKNLTGVDDALAEVNAERARRGLKAFLPDPLLNQAARTCARLRAQSHIHGHLSSDFDHLPAGATASAAGCGALEPSWGWGTCCTYENYTYAGAAWVMGTDGRRYMHLFVR